MDKIMNAQHCEMYIITNSLYWQKYSWSKEPIKQNNIYSNDLTSKVEYEVVCSFEVGLTLANKHWGGEEVQLTNVLNAVVLLIIFACYLHLLISVTVWNHVWNSGAPQSF